MMNKKIIRDPFPRLVTATLGAEKSSDNNNNSSPKSALSAIFPNVNQGFYGRVGVKIGEK